ISAESTISDLNIYIYPEYYYSGIMVEINGKVDLSDTPFSMEMLVPAMTDSVFFVSGSPNDQSEVKTLNIKDANSMRWVHLELNKSPFRIFVFYNPFNSSVSREIQYPLQFSTSLSEFHVFVQEPLISTSFNIDLESTSNKDQHNIVFHQIHFQGLKEMSKEIINLSYDNLSGKTTMQYLQGRSSENSINNDESTQQKDNKIPKRHRLPLWEPIAVLGVLSVLSGVLFFNNNQNKKNGKNKNFCSKCGNKLDKSDKYCSICGSNI
ncbi:MAG: zinc ribbon domain-containing protein, partial [Candidatus Marinimicrobia bacterium]|nr:zinc ribbon domain-containing protein [Candidatus Neomarinimicrobiota bacterium]